MIKRYKYTDKEIKQLLSDITIIIDKREQKNNHITNWFDKKKIKYINKSISCGDYSFLLPKNQILNIERDLYFDKEIIIERKNSTDELIGNFASERSRIETEFLKNKGKMCLLIEDEQFYENISKGNYRSQYNKKSALATYHSFVHRYNIYPHYINKKQSGQLIYLICYYYLRELLK